MNKRGLLFTIPLAILALAAIFLTPPEAASADASDSGQMVIVVGDWNAIWESAGKMSSKIFWQPTK